MKNTLGMVDPLPRDMKKNWRWVMGLGILFILLGTIGLGTLVLLTLASILVLGIFLVIAGVAACIDLLTSKHPKGTVLRTAVALLYIIAGAMVVYDPVLASSMITILLAWTLIVIGAARIAMSVTHREPRIWGWIFFAGLCSLALGVLILVQLPMSALWVIGLFIAIELIINGWSYVFIALTMRKR